MTVPRLFSRRSWSDRLSARTKLLFVIGLSTGLALMLGTLTLLCLDWAHSRRDVLAELRMTADQIGDRCAPALAQRDQASLRSTLTAAGSTSHLALATVYDSEGKLLAQYSRPVGAAQTPVAALLPSPDHIRYVDQGLVLRRGLFWHGQQIGALQLRLDLNGQYWRMWAALLILLAALGTSLGLAVLLRSKQIPLTAAPIAALAAAADRIARERDYSIRVEPQANNEVGDLVEAFNRMVGQIEMEALARSESEQFLRESEERYKLAAEGANDGLWDWDLPRQRLYMSSRWKQILGYGEDEVADIPEEWFSRIHPEDRGRVQTELFEHFNGLVPIFSSEHRMRHRAGHFLWVLCRGLAVRDEQGQPTRAAGSLSDITEGKVGDPLTRLPNRLLLLDRLTLASETARHHPGHRFAVLFLDLDHFKLVNDSLGHTAGDHLLVEVAGRLRACAEAAVQRNPGWTTPLVTRLGGDEFAILLESVRGVEEAIQFTGELLRAVQPACLIGGHEAFVSFSIGIALNTEEHSPENLLRDADTAMYQAKAAGRNCFAVFDISMREKAIRRIQLEADLHHALEAGQFFNVYQPRVSLASLALTGFEALIRWHHPERGLVSPGDFIPVAEETGMIVSLGRWVLREACRQFADWQRVFPTARTLSVSVNISYRELSQPGFVDEVRTILQETGLPPACLSLEMTETFVMKNAGTTVAILKQLKLLGVGLEIDDFGTGYSSLSYLHRLPFDVLKIDRSFVQELGKQDGSTEIVATILKLAHSLRMQVVAEGIETASQLTRLRQLGCTQGQGYHFAKPLEVSAAESYLAETNPLCTGINQLREHTANGGQKSAAALASRTEFRSR